MMAAGVANRTDWVDPDHSYQSKEAATSKCPVAASYDLYVICSNYALGPL